MRDVKVVLNTVQAVLGRPRLWPTALRQGRRLVPPGWWRRWPWLPLPSRDYLRFRLETAYGGTGRAPPRSEDVIAYLEWCRGWRSLYPR